jgi:hypothetical protein
VPDDDSTDAPRIVSMPASANKPATAALTVSPETSNGRRSAVMIVMSGSTFQSRACRLARSANSYAGSGQVDRGATRARRRTEPASISSITPRRLSPMWATSRARRPGGPSIVLAPTAITSAS